MPSKLSFPSGAAVVFVLFAATGLNAEGEPPADPRDRGPNKIDVAAYPTDMQKAYALFADKCSKCHSLARPINARIEKPEYWKTYVRKMMRKPGSAINQEAGKKIYQFLLFHQEQAAKKNKEPSPAP